MVITRVVVLLRENVLHLKQEGSVSARVLQTISDLEEVLDADIDVVFE